MLRLVRLAVELDLEPDADTRARAHAHATALGEVAPERIFMELRRIIDAPGAVAGLELMGEVGATAVVLPELETLRGVTQSHYHHRDVYGHTLEVLEQVIALQQEPAAALGDDGDLYREPLATPLTEPLTTLLDRAARRWADPRGGAALGGVAARRRQAAHSQRASRGRARHVHRTRRSGCTDGR